MADSFHPLAIIISCEVLLCGFAYLHVLQPLLDRVHVLFFIAGPATILLYRPFVECQLSNKRVS
jgi:hypothetical protein